MDAWNSLFVELSALHELLLEVRLSPTPLSFFFFLARAFWNQTCVTRLLSRAEFAIFSRSLPSGLWSRSKCDCRIANCSGVKLVRTRLVFGRPPFSWPLRHEKVQGIKRISYRIAFTIVMYAHLKVNEFT